jgi:hypothetical protein
VRTAAAAVLTHFFFGPIFQTPILQQANKKSRSKHFDVCSDMARGDNPNPLRSFAIFLEKHPNGLLAGGAFAPYKRFATGKTLAQGEFTSPEHFNHRRVERPTGAKPKRKCDLSKQAAFSFGAGEGNRTPVFSLGS